MLKVAIFPPNSLILSDLVERAGHEPLTIMEKIAEKVRDVEIDSPPLNITAEEPSKGLRYASAEAPSGVRGRLSVFGPLYEEADAIIALKDAPMNFGCLGCARTNEFLLYMIKKSGIPQIVLTYPKTEEEARSVVSRILSFLKEVEGND